MIRKSMTVESPGVLLLTLGGAVATILGTSLIYLGPTLGFPLIELPALVGGIFTSDPAVAFWLGFAVFFVSGWLVVPLALTVVWEALPGAPISFAGAAVKGLLFGSMLWVLSGLLVGLLSAVNALPDMEGVGFFAAGYGALGIIGLLGGHLAYGLALAVVAAMGQGLSPLDSLGWQGHGAGRGA